MSPDLAAALHAAPVGVLTLDPRWHVVAANPAMEAFAGRTGLVGNGVWDVLPDLRGTAFEHELIRAVAYKTNADFEIRRPPGGPTYRVSARPGEGRLDVFVTEAPVAGQEQDLIARPLVRRILHDLAEAGAISLPTLTPVGRKLADSVEASDLEGYVAAFTRMGLGSLAVERSEGDRHAFIAQDLLERRPGLRVTTCYFTLGYLTEIVSRVHDGAPTLGTELECQSRGSANCRFIVHVKKPEDGLARRVKELV